MLKRILELLNPTDRDQTRTEKDLAAATAELLLEIGRADFEISPQESEGVLNVLESQFRLSTMEAQSCLDKAIDSGGNSVSVYPLTRLINDKLDTEQKIQLVEQLWEVAFADQRLDMHEEHRIRHIAELLHVPHHDFIRTKLNAQARADISN